jgi:GAF domain-containing protein
VREVCAVVDAKSHDRHRQAKAYARPPLPPDEPARMEALRQYGVLDTLPEQAFDDLTLLAAHICQTPVALISLVDTERQWFKSRIGWDASETPRDMAFCAHAIVAPGSLVVPDALADERFAHNPLVLAEPHIRFYAGAPLRAPDGHALGTLCVIDHVPRVFTKEQRAALEALSRQVMAQLELRRCQVQLERIRADVTPGGPVQ